MCVSLVAAVACEERAVSDVTMPLLATATRQDARENGTVVAEQSRIATIHRQDLRRIRAVAAAALGDSDLLVLVRDLDDATKRVAEQSRAPVNTDLYAAVQESADWVYGTAELFPRGKVLSAGHSVTFQSGSVVADFWNVVEGNWVKIQGELTTSGRVPTSTVNTHGGESYTNQALACVSALAGGSTPSYLLPCFIGTSDDQAIQVIPDSIGCGVNGTAVSSHTAWYMLDLAISYKVFGITLGRGRASPTVSPTAITKSVACVYPVAKITMQSGPDTASTGGSLTIVEGAEVHLEGSWTNATGQSIEATTWKLDGTTVSSGTDAEVSPPLGTHQVTFTVRTGQQISGTATVTIIVVRQQTGGGEDLPPEESGDGLFCKRYWYEVSFDGVHFIRTTTFFDVCQQNGGGYATFLSTKADAQVGGSISAPAPRQAQKRRIDLIIVSRESSRLEGKIVLGDGARLGGDALIEVDLESIDERTLARAIAAAASSDDQGTLPAQERALRGNARHSRLVAPVAALVTGRQEFQPSDDELAVAREMLAGLRASSVRVNEHLGSTKLFRRVLHVDPGVVRRRQSVLR